MEEDDSTGGGDVIINEEAGDEESGEQIEPNHLGPSFDHPELENQVEEDDVDSVGDPAKTARITTRFQGRKHVKVYKNTFEHELI